MFSDTHFHFRMSCGGNPKEGSELLSGYADSNPFFALDIGTKGDDLLSRVDFAKKSVDQMSAEKKELAKKFLYFTAGIWPGVEDIKNRFAVMSQLEKQIGDFESEEIFQNHFVAIGECGIDHHWNPSNPDGRNQDDFTQEIYNGEREMFLMQLDLAKKMDLPIIVHSRDAFEDTLSCIEESGWDRGVIHCYSYGLEEAKLFLDRGWYIAFGGATTYTKKSRMEDMEKLLNYVPSDRILLETDAPYLSPVPLRGKPNSPLNIHLTYEFISAKRKTEPEELCAVVDENIKTLFRV